MDEEIKFAEMMLSSGYMAKATPLYNSTNQKGYSSTTIVVPLP